MDERRDPPPTPEPSVPSQTETPRGEREDTLSPVQKARRAYVTHATARCGQCRDIDRDRCGEGERLYRAWIDVCDDAIQRIASSTP